MRQIILDTETTGLDPRQGHRVIEIAAVELLNRRLTGQYFHRYLNPDRDIDEGALQVHGLTREFLEDKPCFADVVDEFKAFIKGAELIIHNAPFDIGFLNHELSLLEIPALQNEVIDTLKLAREMHPGKKNSLDALCGRYEIDNAHRTLHGALLDTALLAEVYLAMTRGQHSLLDAEQPQARRQTAVAQLDTSRPKLRVIAANEAELLQHRQQLQDIARNGGAAVWQQLEMATKTGG